MSVSVWEICVPGNETIASVTITINFDVERVVSRPPRIVAVAQKTGADME